MKFILIILFVTIYSYCSDLSKWDVESGEPNYLLERKPPESLPDTVDSRLEGWGKPKFKNLLIKVIKGNYPIIKYWEIMCGGTESAEYVLIRTPDSLDTYWKNLEVSAKISKPEVDFTKNMLVIAKPGHYSNAFRYWVNITEKNNSIKLTISDFIFCYRCGLAIGGNPIFAFELPASPKTVEVRFDITSQKNFSGYKK